MRMPCPYCTEAMIPRALHAHLVEVHPDRITVSDDGREYGIDCPHCEQGHSERINPNLREPGLLEEYSHELRLVAFDMLINHLLAEHGETEVALPAARTPGGSHGRCA